MAHIVYVDNRAAFMWRMDRNYRNKHERLRQLEEISYVDVYEAMPVLKSQRVDLLMIGVFGCPLHPLFPHDARWPMKLYDEADRTCLVIEDLHDHTYGGGFRSLYGYIERYVDYVIAMYDNSELDQLKQHCPRLKGVYVVPHCLDTRIYRDYGLPKQWDILLFGNCSPDVYPFRRRLRELIRARFPRVCEPRHPGYSKYDGGVCGESLAKMINQSLMAVATPSIYDCLVAKYFEISAGRCVVAGKIATQGAPIWGDNCVHLDERMCDDEIVRTLSGALANPDRLAEKADAMYQWIQRNASLDNFADTMRGIFHAITAG